MPVINIIEDLLLLAASTYTDPLDIEDLLLLAVSTYKDPLVLAQITLT